MIEYQYVKLYRDTSIPKKMEIRGDGILLTEENWNAQSMELTENLCSENTLHFGSCNASTFKIRIRNNVIPLKGKTLTVTQTLKGAEDAPFQIGVYKVDSDKPTADRRYRDIVAYDAMYDINSANVADWYNTILPDKDSSVTLKQFRDSFFTHMGIEQEPILLTNDEMQVEKTIDPSGLFGRTVITCICELNGCFGHINRQGRFEYKFLPEIISGLYPAEDLYPADDLFPRDASTELISSRLYRSCTYEDYQVRRINKLQIHQEENDIGGIAGDGDNCYIIEDNFLVYGKGHEELVSIAGRILEVISKVSYRPFNAEAKGNPCIEVGDAIRLHTRDKVVESYVLQRTLKGIQALKDSYSAEGKETYKKEDSIHESILQLKGKTNVLTRTVEETRSEITDLEAGVNTGFSQTAAMIEAEANRATEEEGKLSSKISLTAERISSEVERATNAEGNLSSKISQTAESISSEVARATDAEGSLSSKISQTAESISSEITRATNAESGLSSRISQTVEQIELKVTKGDVSSQLSLESGQVTLKSNRFVLESTNCSISKDGTITAKNFKGINCDLSGKITADSGQIGSLVISSKGLSFGKISINDGRTGVYVGTDGIAVGYGGTVTSAFKVTDAGDVSIGSAGGITIESSTPLVLTASTAYVRHLTSNAIEFSSSTTSIISTYSVLGKYGGQIGFFGDKGAARKTVSTISSTSSASASTTATKVNELINALKAYNLIG